MRMARSSKAFDLIAVICATLLLCSCGSTLDKLSIPDEYDYDDLSQYITLGEYKGIEYENAENQVSQSEIKEVIDELLADTAETKKSTSGVVKADSVINMDYVGSMNGVEFDGGTGSDIDFDIADNNYIDGFAEEIIGHKAGTTFDIHVTFPDNYGSEDLAGKPATFKITVNYIEEKIVPEYSNEWVKKNTDYSSMEELEQGVKEELLANKDDSSLQDARTDIFNKILDDCEVVEYPEKEYNLRYNQLVNTYKGYAEEMDMDFEDYLSDQMGMSLEDFEQTAEESARTAVKQELVLHAIAKAEKIKISESEYKDFVETLLTDAGYTEESFESERGYTIKEYADSNNLYTSFLLKKVMDKVMDYSIAK